jgi:predicted N-acyltransferase
MMDRMQVHRSIDEFDALQWDRLAADSVFASVGWLRTVETHYRGGVEPYYVSIGHGERMVGAAVCYVFQKTDEVETPDDVWLGRAKQLMNRLGVSFLPALVCGTAFGNSSPVLVDAELSDSDRLGVIQELLAGVETQANKLAVGVGFLHVLESDSGLQESLGSRGYLAALDVPYAVMDISWDSYDGYLDHLPRKNRREFRRQSNRHRKSTTKIETLIEVGDREADLRALVDLNSIKHNGRPFAFRDGFFGAVKKNLTERAQLYRASTDEASTGICLTLCGGQEIFTTIIGVDRSAVDDFTYFEIGYRFPIAVAAARQIRRVHYARSMYAVKRRRGCYFINSTNYCKPRGWRRNLAQLWLALLSAWNKGILDRES